MKNEQKKKQLSWFGIPAVAGYMKPYVKAVFVMMLFGTISSVIDSVFPLFNRYALDHYVGEGILDTVGVFILLYVFLLLIQVVVNYVSTYLCSKVELGIGRDLKNETFSHLQTLSLGYFNTNSVGYLHARIMSDTDRIGVLCSWRLMDVAWNLSYIVCVFVVMLFIRPALALLLLALVPVAALLSLLFQKKLVRLNRDVRELNSRITGQFNEGITGAKSIRSLVVEDIISEEFMDRTKEMRKTATRSGHYAALFSASVTFLSSAALALVLWKGGALTRAGLMQIGTLSVFMSYALGMIEPIQNLIRMLTDVIAIQANIERFRALMHTVPDVNDTPEVIAEYGDFFSPKTENWEDIRGDVLFDDVSFHYPDGDELVLDHFSLHVAAGTNVAIVGETGAGKSTLVNLVCRFYEPTSGRVLIDGKDVKDRSQLWLHSHIGYVLQTPHLFSGTVRDNIRFGNENATDGQILEALKLVSADRIIERMEKGLDSDVGEGGDLLSTGEKQLISFARAIIADPAILILDEATSSVDTVTEKLLQDAIRTVTGNRTSFVVAHRLSTIVNADLILVVRDGKIIESGTHRELLQKGGYYKDLYTRQHEDTLTRLALQ